MGYWNTDENGISFSDSPKDMVWGDAPADAMDEALHTIIAAFRRDLGRAPSLDELKAGLLFSAQAALDADEERRQENQLYTYEVVTRWSWTDFDGRAATSEDSTFYDAVSADDARAQYEADQDPELDARVGMERALVSIEQIEPTRTHKARGQLSLVKDSVDTEL